MAKIIHASQMLETPQINILNDNVIDSVNYSYNNITFNTASDYSFIRRTIAPYTSNEKFTIYEDNSINTNFSGTMQSANYTTFYRMKDSIKQWFIIIPFTASIPSELKSIDKIPLNVGVVFVKTMNDSSYNSYYELVINDEYIGSDYSGDKCYLIPDNIEVSTISDYVSTTNTNYTSYIKINTFTNQEMSGYYVKFLIGYGSTAYDDTLSSLSANLELQMRNVFKLNETTQINNNSQVSLESNELITQDTKVDGIQISEYIANDIKSHYENGKATISMQVIDDGTEYDVNDIIQPMKTRLETVTETFEPRVVDSEIVDEEYNYTLALFKAGRKFFIISTISDGGSVTRVLKVFSSSDGRNWKEINTNLLSLIGSIDTSSWRVWNANNKVFIQCRSQYSTYLVCTEDGNSYKLVHTSYSSSDGDFEGVVYYKGYYYIKMSSGRLYRFLLSVSISTELITTFDFSYGTITVFKDKLYVIGQQDYTRTIIVSSTDGQTFDNQILEINGQFMSNAQSDNYLILCSQNSTGGILITSDGENWEQNTTLWGSIISYNQVIDAFIISVSGRTAISYDNGSNWETMLSRGGNFLEYINNLYICMQKINNPFTFVFYNQAEKDVEYPLLTNSDGTAKTFEITSSELVFDGSAYYNIDAVEKIMPTASLQNGSSTLSVNVTTSSDDTYAFMTINESQIYQYPIHKITSIDVSIKTSNSSVLTGQMVYDENTDEWEFIQYFNDTDYFIQCFFYKEDSNYIFDIDSYTSETLPTTYSGTVTVNLQYYK